MSSYKKSKTKSKEKNQAKSERIPNETIDYYKRVSETLNEEFSSNEDKEIFITNVLAQFKEDGMRVCRLAGISRVLEKLITCANITHITLVFSVLRADWSSVITDRIASHVLQLLISQVPKCLQSISDTDNEEGDSCDIEDLFIELCEHISDNFTVYWSDTYGSHIMRVILQVLGGVAVNQQVIRSRLSRNQQKEEHSGQFSSFTPPDKFKKMLKTYAKHIFEEEILKDGIYCPMGSPVIQTLLLVSQKVSNKRCQKYLHKLVAISQLCQADGTDQKQSLPLPVTHDIGSYLVEQILNLGSEQLCQEIYTGSFQGRLLRYAVHPVANFILQKYLSNLKDNVHFEDVFSELVEYMEDILAVNHLGVITHMAEACLRLGCKQERMIKCLMKAFHCSEPEERKIKFVPLVASLTTYEVFFGIDEDDSKDKDVKQETKEKKIPILQKINFHGALLLQHLLKFGNPKTVVSGLLQLKPVELMSLSCDPCGSHVIDVFFQSSTVGEKSRDLLLNRMKDIYIEMACSRNGSRTLEVIWKTASVKQKINIAQQLSKHEAKVRGDQYGHFIHRNFGLFHFVHRRKDWEELQSNKAKKHKLFSDIFNDGPQRKKTKKADGLTSEEKKTDIDESGEEESNSQELDDKDEEKNQEAQNKKEAKDSHKEVMFEKKQKVHLKPKSGKLKISDKRHHYRIKDKGMLSLLSEIDPSQKKKKKKTK